MKNKTSRIFLFLSVLGISLLFFEGISFYKSHKNSGMISVVAGDKTKEPLTINLKDYLPFDSNSKINYKKSEFQITNDIPVLDGAIALYPVYSAIATSLYPEEAIHFNGENFTPESKVQMRNTKGAYKAIVDGNSDIIFCASPSKEQQKYAHQHGIELGFIPIGLEAFVFIENINNPVNDLSIKQIKDIYSGKITNWKNVGGENKLIAAWQRAEGSGSQTTFLNFMNGIETKTNPVGLFLGSPLGYSFRYYVEGLTKNENVKMISLNGIAPTKENIQNGTYPVSSYFYAIYRKNDKSENVINLIKWILSPEGQETISNNGYIPLK